MHQITRRHAAQLGRDTRRILEAGRYQTVAGAVVDIDELVQRAVAGTCSYPPNQHPPRSRLGEKQTQVTVNNESTLVAARKLVEKGFRRLVGNEMYEVHQAGHDPVYTNYAIYSPDVPVFREDDGTLLDRPYLCAFITAPAVNAKAVLQRNRSRRHEILEVMRQRVLKVLAIAAEHDHEALVLGAWGCARLRERLRGHRGAFPAGADATLQRGLLPHRIRHSGLVRGGALYRTVP